MLRSDVIKRGCDLFEVSLKEIMDDCRPRHICRARFGLYYALNKRGGSSAAIGRWLKRDHSTVLHGLTRAEWYMENDPDFRQIVESLIVFGRIKETVDE